jgi:hypothetical protein
MVIKLIFRKRGVSCKYDKENLYPIKHEELSENLSYFQLPTEVPAAQNYVPEVMI